MTKKRQCLLAALKAASGTVSAAELHRSLPDIDLVTIYRNLDIFLAAGLIKRVHLASGEARFEHQPEPHHHAICTQCEKVLHFKAPDERIKQLLQLENFDVDEIEVIVRGRCKARSHL